jgi:hypothetical protein|uniref:Uncharacterized protein n=1 Tax=uncultured virus TaxID=340016 RepID=D5L2L7_9VIRU|nr:hypothetical protein [uncultured virus]
MSDELDRHLTRLTAEHEETLGSDFELAVRSQGEQPTRYRLVIRPVYSRTGESWESDLSPGYPDPDLLAAHMRGMSTTREIAQKAELFHPEERPDDFDPEAEP